MRALQHGGYSCRGRREVEAESVAWLISAHFGLDTGGYTLPYVAAWAHAADREGAVNEVRAAFAAVSAAHRRILTALDRDTAARGRTASPDRAPHGRATPRECGPATVRTCGPRWAPGTSI